MLSLLLLTLAATPLDTAREHLKAGRLDDVLFALDGKAFEADDKPKAAQLLGEAANAALAKKDDLLALQFAQQALSLDPKQPQALEAAARTAFSQQQFDAAEGYADRWILAEPKKPAPRVLRAQLAVEAGEWDVAIDQLNQVKDARGADAELAKSLRAQASKASTDKHAALSSIAALEQKVGEAAAKARQAGPGSGGHAATTTGVVIYTAAWCGYCKQAKAFLKQKGVQFVERDIEKDAGAAQELADKAASAGVQARGVPVIDVRGRLILGFDRAGLEAAL